VGFFDTLFGRRKPVGPNLDALFSVPSAAITLQVSEDLLSTGKGAVAFRSVEGRAMADLEVAIQQLLGVGDKPPVRVVSDDYGFTWIVVSDAEGDVSAVVTDLHAVNTSLAEQGFGPQLLCSLIPFKNPEGVVVSLIYLYKRGTFYPFVPEPGEDQRRDSIAELRIRDLLAGELPWESDLGRWFPVWGAPGLD
jgi:hypothetical protein